MLNIQKTAFKQVSENKHQTSTGSLDNKQKNIQLFRAILQKATGTLLLDVQIRVNYFLFSLIHNGHISADEYLLNLSVALRLWFSDALCLAVASSSSCHALSLYCPPHARPHATVYSLLQVVAAQLFRHPFRSGNTEWQKELAPSFHITKKEKKKTSGRRSLSCAGTTDTEVSQNSSLPPKEQTTDCLNW